MADATIPATVRQLDEVKSTQSGTPQRGVLTEHGWIKIRGANVGMLEAGASIVITEPTDFKGKKYSELKSIGDRQATPTPASPSAPRPASAPATSTAAPRSSGGWVSPMQISITAYLEAIRDFHKIAGMIEPDVMVPASVNPDGSKVMTVAVDRSSARAAILNTFSIALTSGKISMETAKAAPAADVPPWEQSKPALDIPF